MQNVNLSSLFLNGFLDLTFDLGNERYLSKDNNRLKTT